MKSISYVTNLSLKLRLRGAAVRGIIGDVLPDLVETGLNANK